MNIKHRNVIAVIATVVIGGIALPSSSLAGNDGINRLISVTQQKTNNANDEAAKATQAPKGKRGPNPVATSRAGARR